MTNDNVTFGTAASYRNTKRVSQGLSCILREKEHAAKQETVPEAPCDASSVRAVDELAPSWLLSESAIFSCRRASAATRLPRPEPRRLTKTTPYFYCITHTNLTTHISFAIDGTRLICKKLLWRQNSPTPKISPERNSTIDKVSNQACQAPGGDGHTMHTVNSDSIVVHLLGIL